MAGLLTAEGWRLASTGLDPERHQDVCCEIKWVSENRKSTRAMPRAPGACLGGQVWLFPQNKSL